MEAGPPKTDLPKRKRRWFQFSLRTLLICTVVVAVASAWLTNMVQQKRRQQAAVDALRKKGAEVIYEYSLVPGKSPPGPAWARWLLGDDYFSEVIKVNMFGDVGDNDLSYIAEFPQLDKLELSGPRFTDAALIRLAHLNQLHINELKIVETSITGAGLEKLTDLPHLNGLWFFKSNMTDADLVRLGRLTQLAYLCLRSDRISDGGVDELQKVLPGCKILH